MYILLDSRLRGNDGSIGKLRLITGAKKIKKAKLNHQFRLDFFLWILTLP
jgi:hypothetical protein